MTWARETRVTLFDLVNREGRPARRWRAILTERGFELETPRDPDEPPRLVPPWKTIESRTDRSIIVRQGRNECRPS